jgi:lipopolysaccharide transport system permease protein
MSSLPSNDGRYVASSYHAAQRYSVRHISPAGPADPARSAPPRWVVILFAQVRRVPFIQRPLPRRRYVTAALENGFELTARPTPAWALISDTWRSRDLVFMLAKKEFVSLYRRATLGMAWAVGLPLLQAVVLAVVFSQVAKIRVAGVSYPTFVYTGTLAWGFFSNTLNNGVGSIVDGQSLATKIYFPRVVFPLSKVGSNLFAFLPGLPLLVIFAAVFHVHLGVSVLLLIPAAALMVALSSAVSTVSAALQVYFRDMRYIVQALLLPWFWASAIFFPTDRVHGYLQRIVEINPATGMILLFRAAVVGADPNLSIAVAWSCAWTAFFLAIALVLYRRFDRVFVDLL